MKIKALAILAMAVLVFSSCSTKRSPLTYFENIDYVAEQPISTTNYNPAIQPDDELLISVNSISPSATAAYNLPLSNPANQALGLKTTSPQMQTYLVDSEGYITMPIIGKLHVAGMTTEQLQQSLVKRISEDVEDPEVLVRLINFTVNVAGEVKTPGPINITRERFSILDALTAAGDLTEFGERNNVLLIREEDGKRVAHRLNLNDANLLTSPYFYVRQNDYIYVQPNKIRQDNSKYNQNNAFKVSVISTIVSACSVVASLVIALTVK